MRHSNVTTTMNIYVKMVSEERHGGNENARN
jgi:hypothetical protein